MPRFSSSKTLSPAGTNLPAGASVSNSAIAIAASDARLFIYVAAISGTLDVFIQTSDDNTRFVDIGAPNQISAIGDFIFAIETKLISKFLRARYVVSGGGSATLETVLEKKHGT